MIELNPCWFNRTFFFSVRYFTMTYWNVPDAAYWDISGIALGNLGQFEVYPQNKVRGILFSFSAIATTLVCSRVNSRDYPVGPERRVPIKKFATDPDRVPAASFSLFLLLCIARLSPHLRAPSSSLFLPRYHRARPSPAPLRLPRCSQTLLADETGVLFSTSSIARAFRNYSPDSRDVPEPRRMRCL